MLFFLLLARIFTGSSVNSSITNVTMSPMSYLLFSCAPHLPMHHSVLVFCSKDGSFNVLQFSGIPLRPFSKLIASKSTLCIPGAGEDSKAGCIPHTPQSLNQLFHPWVLQISWVKIVSSNLSLWSSSSTSLGVTMGFFGQWEAAIIRKFGSGKPPNLADRCEISSPK